MFRLLLYRIHIELSECLYINAKFHAGVLKIILVFLEIAAYFGKYTFTIKRKY
jgi:hypothetical protein